MLKTIDLFAGAGGLSLGFEMTGQFEILAAAEINKNAQATYKKNLTKGKEYFTFINNVLGYDFKNLSEQLGGVDVVIGGPPCQGFSNANRQKNHLISMNNGLVKEYFRTIKQIRPKAFIMENVNMLRSDTHRFYESTKDYVEIEQLIANGFNIHKREDTLTISEEKFENIDYTQIDTISFIPFIIPADLFQLLSVLNKNIGNEKRLPNFLKKNSKDIIKQIEVLTKTQDNAENVTETTVVERLLAIKDALIEEKIEDKSEDVAYIVNLEKMISTVNEIKNNGLIGKFDIDEKETLIYKVNSYSVIDYVNAILGGEYVQVGNTVNAEWFGVPQERRRYKT